MSRLRFRDRLLARSVARKAWILSEGRGDDALLIFKNDDRITAIDPALILLLVQIALALWKFWQEHNVTEPSEVIQVGEPGFEEENDAD